MIGSCGVMAPVRGEAVCFCFIWFTAPLVPKFPTHRTTTGTVIELAAGIVPTSVISGSKE